jgi:hypothetical protein
MAMTAPEFRAEIIKRAQIWAESAGAPWYHSKSTTLPVALFEPYVSEGVQRHGNFIEASYLNAISDPHWAIRLAKPHPRRNALPSPVGESARELDSCTSSDALLLNMLCHPAASEGVVRSLQGKGPPEFGVGGGIPKLSRQSLVADQSELDLIFRGNRGSIAIIVEAKLAEADFARKRSRVVEQYASFATVFDVPMLERRGDEYCDYQLIRNLLAAHYHHARFLLLYDVRRADLRERFEAVLSAVKPSELIKRCSAITWQQLVRESPRELRNFLAEKYGIVG